MNTASTDMPEPQSQEEEDKKREQNRNFWIAIFQGIFGRISFSLSDSTTVLSAFIYKLTASNTLVGLTGSLMSVGWMWPQLLISNLLEHRPRKMPFYILGMSVHTAVWLAAAACTVWIECAEITVYSLRGFIFLYFLGTSSMGASSVAYMDIISKTIEPLRRARFFSIGNFIGGFFTIFIGFLVRYILSDTSGFVFPNNYALLFFGVAFMAVISLFVFLKIREPIRPVQTERKTFWQHIKQGPHFLQTDRNYRDFIGVPDIRQCRTDVHALLRTLCLRQIEHFRWDDWAIPCGRRCKWGSVEHSVGLYEWTVRCSMDTDLHRVARLHSTASGNLYSVSSTGMAVAVLFFDVCPRRRIHERYDGRIHDIHDQYCAPTEPPHLYRFHEHVSIPFRFYAGACR